MKNQIYLYIYTDIECCCHSWGKLISSNFQPTPTSCTDTAISYRHEAYVGIKAEAVSFNWSVGKEEIQTIPTPMRKYLCIFSSSASLAPRGNYMSWPINDGHRKWLQHISWAVISDVRWQIDWVRQKWARNHHDVW